MPIAPTSEAMAPAVDPQWAWQPYQPDGRRPWSLALAAHLYRRAAFGATRAELDLALSAGPQATVERLLAPPAALAAEDRQFDAYEASTESTESLRGWWLQRMMQTAWPLRERMTLFWHSHFAASAAGISGSLLRTRVALLRRHALGRYGELLAELLIDPAVLIGLGAADNRRARTHEDSARAVLAHWCVGEGNFGESDVRALATAYTGWFVLRERRRYIEREHEPAPQTLLGQPGVAGIDGAAKVLAAHPAATRLIARKLYRAFISDEGEPDAALLAPLAEVVAREGDIAAAVGAVLRSNLFFSPAAVERRVKTPLEFALGVIRPMEARVPALRLGQDLAALGQSLYDPPAQTGWPAGRDWLDSASLVARANLAAALVATEGPYGGNVDPLAIAQKHSRQSGEEIAGLFCELLLGRETAPDERSALVGEVPSASGPRSAWARQSVYRIATLPEYQLC